MPFDGGFLHKIEQELEPMIGARVDKIGQPNRDCVVIHLHNRGPARRLVILAGAAPRLHFSAIPIEYPATPPMFCLLLRKHLGGGRLTGVTQQGLDRVLTLHFEAANELGDRANFRLVCELMGRQGNLVLVGENGKVIDALHRVDFAASESRPLLSGLEYCYPPRQDKLDLTVTAPLDAADRLLSGPHLPLSKALLAVLEGASPLVCRELSYRIAPGDPAVGSLSPVQRAGVSGVLGEWAAALSPTGGTPLLLGGPKPDFTFLPQTQYEGTDITQTPYPTCSELLEEFYRLKTGSEGVKLAGEGLRRQVSSIHERLLRKRTVRLQEMEKSENRDRLRLFGDLLSANLYRMQKGMAALTCEDYTADPPVPVTIPLDVRLTPSRNVQKYYTEYRKAANAEAVLRRLIAECEDEITYIESVEEALRRATTEGELLEIREELRQQGYLKAVTPKGQRPLQKRRGGTLPPLRYRSDDGYTILCGRNNLQNDQLTLKTAHGTDLWFHIQKQPGSHVILLTGGTPLDELPDRTIEQAAMLAACNSSGRESSRVPIDYTLVKNIKKPNGARPGMVIYETYYTMLTTPDHAAAGRLLEK